MPRRLLQGVLSAQSLPRHNVALRKAFGPPNYSVDEKIYKTPASFIADPA
jgi:hypothetical protein